MPIRPENRGRYPADWKTISTERKDAAGWRCERYCELIAKRLSNQTATLDFGGDV